MDYYVLAVNPGTKSTRLAVYKNEELLFRESVEHPSDELEFFEDFYDQHNFRTMVIMGALKKRNFDVSLLSCVVGRGGMLPRVEVGGYKVNDLMEEYLVSQDAEPHVSNLGCMIAKDIGDELNIPSYIYDAISANNVPEEALITGFPEVERKCYSHVLNARAAAVKYAKERSKKYEDIKVIVANLGSGITVSAHYLGKIVDVAGNSDGPMAPERSGLVPLKPVIKLCYDGKYSRKQMYKKVRGEGGIKAYLGTGDMVEVEKMIEAGNKKAELLVKAMFLQTSKAIGSVAASVKGDVEAVILTGGMSHSQYFTDMIRERVSFIAPVFVIPGENELEALAMGALRILKGEEHSHEFTL